MKRNFQQFIINYFSEGLTVGLSKEDKALTLLSMNLSNDTSNKVFDEVTGNGNLLKEMEVEESELLEFSGTLITAVLESLTASKLKQLVALSFERNKLIIGLAAAKKMRTHDQKIARKLVSNLKKLQSNAKFQADVAKKCHLKIIK